jgi:hypothetical protein
MPNLGALQFLNQEAPHPTYAPSSFPMSPGGPTARKVADQVLPAFRTEATNNATSRDTMFCETWPQEILQKKYLAILALSSLLRVLGYIQQQRMERAHQLSDLTASIDVKSRKQTI